MIKNKNVNIKIIFKTYLKKIKNMLKIILDFQRDFYSIKNQRRFSKIIFLNYFFRTVLKNNYQTKT